ncbi:MAG TPA: hypothetical protein VF025_02855 [Gaiellaceae bacterium]
MRRRPIGQILVEKHEISEVELQAALAEQARTGRRLGEILIESGQTSWLALARALAEQVLDIEEAEPAAPPPPRSVAVRAVEPEAEIDRRDENPETKLQSVEAMLRERQRAFIELVTTTETLRMKVARLEEILEERDRELTRLRLLQAG